MATTPAFEQQILALETEFWQAMQDRDTAAAVRLTADPCLITGAQGASRIDHKAFAKMMDGGGWKLKAFSFSDVSVVEVTGDVAVIAYKVRETLTVDGKSLEMEAADASTWVRRNGAWVCILHTELVAGDPFGRDRKPA